MFLISSPFFDFTTPKMSTAFPNNNNKKRKKITAEQTIILIRLIKKYKSLWDPNHKDFRNRTLSDHLYEKIGKYFQLNAEDVRMKFRRFRNCYRQELKQVFDGQKDQSGLFYFDEMEFLREQMEQRFANRRLSCGSTTEDLDDAEGLTTESYEELYSIEDGDCGEPASKKTDTALEIMENVELEIGDMPNTDQNEQGSSVSESKTDEFDIFAGYLASQLREMDKLSALETMEELQQIISQRRIGILKNNLKRKVGPTATVQYRYTLQKNKRDN